MKNILKSLQFLKNYKLIVFLNIFVTIIVSILEIFSLISIVPLLDILFSKETTTSVLEQPESFSIFPLTDAIENIKLQFNYFSNQLFIQHSKQQLLIWICLFSFGMFLLKNIFVYLDNVMDRYIRFNVVRDQKEKVYNKVLQLPIHFFNSQKRGDILTRFTSDIDNIRISALGGYKMLFKQPIKILSYIVTMLFISVKLTLFIFLLIPILGFIISRISKTLKKRTHKVQDKSANLLALLDETMFGAKIIKSFTAEPFLQRRFTDANEDFTKTIKSIERRRVAASPVSEVLGIGIVMLVMWYGGQLILAENTALTGSLFTGFIVLFARLIDPIKQLSGEYSSLATGMASAERIEFFLSQKNEFGEDSSSTPVHFENKIEIHNLNFTYPESEKQVINGYNLTLKKGTTTALVGQSGAGKSTIADLLPRFYDAEDNSISIDGQPINSYSKYQVRSLIAYVSQEAILFNDTIYNNISFGMKHVTREQVIEAAKAANAHDFILNLEHGYETSAGERGSKLSGGQKQRITIARAILKNAPILILDEATSALDTESERLVQNAIEKLLENRTALVIAHRLSTIKNADQICVMQNGEIVEVGTHDQLIEKDGHYKTLTDMQAI